MVDTAGNIAPNGPVVLFDGVCNLCHGTVRFIVKRDRRRRFRFASLQSGIAHQLLAPHGLQDNGLDSVILLHRGRCWTKSSAALHIARQLDGLWPLMSIFLIVPPFLRDAVYDFIGNRRYRWFGQRDHCDLPDIGDNSRFFH